MDSRSFGEGIGWQREAVSFWHRALLWNTRSADRSTSYITAALVTGGQIRVSRGASSLTGHIAAITAGDLVLLCYKMLSPLKIPAAAGYRKGEWVLFKRRSRQSRTFVDWFGRLW